MAASKDPKLTTKDAISSKGPNNVVPRMLEAARKKQHDIVSAKPNDAVSSGTSSPQMTRIRALPLAHFTEARWLIKNWTQTQAQAQVTNSRADPSSVAASRERREETSR